MYSGLAVEEGGYCGFWSGMPISWPWPGFGGNVNGGSGWIPAGGYPNGLGFWVLLGGGRYSLKDPCLTEK